MRNIKFRAKELHEPSKWQYGYYIKHKLINPCPVMFSDERLEDKIPKYEEYLIIEQDGDWNMESIQYKVTIKPETIGQYTGLKDKNGKEIYEGDILEVNKHFGSSDYEQPSFIGKVVFEDYGWFVKNEHYCEDLWELEHNIGFKLLGNIYDNGGEYNGYLG